MSKKYKAEAGELKTDPFTVVFDDAVLSQHLTIPTPTSTSTPTKTPTSTPTKTPTLAPTKTPTNAPTKTPTQQPTSTATPPPGQTSTATPTSTSTPTPGQTPGGTGSPSNGDQGGTQGGDTPADPQNQEQGGSNNGGGTITPAGDGKVETLPTNIPAKPSTAAEHNTPGAPDTGTGSGDAGSLEPVDFALPAGLAALGLTLAVVAIVRRRTSEERGE